MLGWNRHTRPTSLPTSQAMLGKDPRMNISLKEERQRPSISQETPEKMSTVQTVVGATMVITISRNMIVITTVTIGMLKRNINGLGSEVGPL